MFLFVFHAFLPLAPDDFFDVLFVRSEADVLSFTFDITYLKIFVAISYYRPRLGNLEHLRAGLGPSAFRFLAT